jgi:hypothetical protein
MLPGDGGRRAVDIDAADVGRSAQGAYRVVVAIADPDRL